MTTAPSAASELLRRLDLPADDPPPSTSPHTFPDGARFRIEIPSVEGPGCMQTVLDEAAARAVPVVRCSQGSGVFMLTDDELDQMAELGHGAGVEVSLFARPCAGWGASATARAPAGGGFASVARGAEQLRFALDDIVRAAAHGVRSVLISDVGLLAAFGQLRARGDLPADMQAKVSALLPIANPATAKVLVELGANTLNLQTDLSLEQIAAIRSVVDVPLDIYVEAPDSLGGFVRLHELPELVRIASPVYCKFGLRNAPDVYPSGLHLDTVTRALSRERVRRAQLGLELLVRCGVDTGTSAPFAPGLAVPRPREVSSPVVHA